MNTLEIFPIQVLEEELDVSPATTEFLDSAELIQPPENYLDVYPDRSADSYILRCEELAELNEQIHDLTNGYCAKVLELPFDITVTQSWISEAPKGRRLTEHLHPNSFLSGVYYWQDDLSPLKFRYQKGGLHQNNLNVLSDEDFFTYEMKPKSGHLYVFPSYLKHHVDPTETDAPRRTLAYNAVPRSIGTEYHLTETFLS